MTEKVTVEFQGVDHVTTKTEKIRKGNEALQAQSKISFTELKSAIDIASQALQKLKQGYDFAREGAQLEFTAIKFDRLAATINTTGEALQNKLMTATKGTLSEMQAMAVATDILSLGLVKTEKDTVRLAAVQSGLAMDTNQLVLALTNQTTMRFDQLGVSVAGFEEKVKSLEATGMSAQDAFTEAFLQQAEEQLVKVGSAADTTLGQFLKFEAATQDLKTTFQQFAAVAVSPALPQLTKDLKAATWQVENFRDIWNEMNRLRGEGFGGTIMGVIDFQDLQVQAEYNVKLAEGREKQAEYMESVYAAAEAAREQAAATAAAGEEMTLSAEQLEAIAERNGDFVSTLHSIDSALDDYQEGLAEVDQALADGEISTEEHAAKVSELAGEYESAKNKIILSIVEMKLASDGWTNAELEAYLKVGQKLGEFTQDTVDAAGEVLTTVDEMVGGIDDATGPMTHVGERAEDASDAFGDMAKAGAELGESMRKEVSSGASAATNAINSIPKQTDINVDVWIKTHGSVPSFVGGGGSGQGNTGQEIAQNWLNNHNTDVDRDSGGPGYAGQAYFIGRGAQPEMFVPSTNGTFIPNADRLMQRDDSQLIAAIESIRLDPRDLAMYIVTAMDRADW